MKRKRKTGDANSIYEPRRSVGRHQPKMSESPTIYVHITLTPDMLAHVTPRGISVLSGPVVFDDCILQKKTRHPLTLDMLAHVIFLMMSRKP